MGNPFEQTISTLKSELSDLVTQRNSLETRILKVGTALEGLANLLEDPERKARYLDEVRSMTARIGFTEAVRSALAFKPGATAVQIRDLIEESGWMDFSTYSNPLASIHTTLRRMKESDEIKEEGEGFRLKLAGQIKHPGSLRNIVRPRAPKPPSEVGGRG